MAIGSRLGGSVLLGSLLLVCGCKDSQESILKELIATVKEMTVVLNSVTDEASAKAARPKLQQLTERMHSLKQRADAAPKATSSEEVALHRKYQTQMQEAMLAFVKEMMRVNSDPSLQGAVKNLQAPDK